MFKVLLGLAVTTAVNVTATFGLKLGDGRSLVVSDHDEGNDFPGQLDELPMGNSDCLPSCNCSVTDTGRVEIVTCFNANPQLVFDKFEHVRDLTLVGCLTSYSSPAIDAEAIDNSTGSSLHNNSQGRLLVALERLVLDDCSLDLGTIQHVASLPSLVHLSVVNTPAMLSTIDIDCNVVRQLKTANFTGGQLADSDPLALSGGSDSRCNASQLRSLDLSHNQLVRYRLERLADYPQLRRLSLAANQLVTLEPPIHAHGLRQLIVRDNVALRSLCGQTFNALSNLTYLDISNTGIKQLSVSLFQLKILKSFLYEGVILTCDCQTPLRLRGIKMESVFEKLKCKTPQSDSIFHVADLSILESMNCVTPIIETHHQNDSTEILVGTEVRLDCPVVGDPSHETLWLTPRTDLLRLTPGLGTCPGFQKLVHNLSIRNVYTDWEGHYVVLQNGSLLIDTFGWADRGEFVCYIDNGITNSSASIALTLNYHYRNRIYYLSLAFGFGSAGCFLGLTLLGKLLHYLLWNYGCCLCCSCCKDQQPPKIKRLTKVVDSIETYRIQQLEKLRDNYQQQSLRIRDNYTLQLERVRDNYNSQVKSLKDMKTQGSAQYAGMKEQYQDQITRIRDYSSGQLERCHENYIFQRQRLRKFSAQNYLKIRERRKYTQKTLNRVMENMPALYLDLSSCKQRPGDNDLRDWHEEIDRREAEMKDILSIEMGLEQEMQAVGDSQSLYFTPSGTPMRDVAADNVAKEDGKVVSPRRSPEKGAKSHKRMMSNLSNFSFWWGPKSYDTVETVAIVENNSSVEDSESTNLLPPALSTPTDDTAVTVAGDVGCPSSTVASTSSSSQETSSGADENVTLTSSLEASVCDLPPLSSIQQPVVAEETSADSTAKVETPSRRSSAVAKASTDIIAPMTEERNDTSSAQLRSNSTSETQSKSLLPNQLPPSQPNSADQPTEPMTQQVGSGSGSALLEVVRTEAVAKENYVGGVSANSVDTLVSSKSAPEALSE